MVSPDWWRYRKHQWVACAFAFVGGYSDVISVTRWDVFVTMCTGNTIFLGRVLLMHDPEQGEVYGPGYYLLIIGAWFAGAILYRLGERKFPARGASILALPFAVLVLTLELWLLHMPPTNLYRFTAVGYAPMFGILCTACISGRLGTTTTMATGHLLSLSAAFVKFCYEGRPSPSDRFKVLMSVLVIVFVILGSFVGAVVHHSLPKGAHGGLLPVAPALLVLLWCHDHLTKPQKLVKRIQKKARKRKQSAVSNTSPVVDIPDQAYDFPNNNNEDKEGGDGDDSDDDSSSDEGDERPDTSSIGGEDSSDVSIHGRGVRAHNAV